MTPQISITVSVKNTTPPARPPLWRVLHWAEQTDNTRPYSRPEVEPMYPNHFSPFGYAWQLLSHQCNPLVNAQKWSSVYGNRTWMTNGQGFGDEKDPRVNYVTGENIGASLPKVESLTGGGNLLTGYVSGLDLVVDVLDWHMAPSLEKLKQEPWHLTYAVIVDVKGIPRRFDQGRQPDGSVVPFLHPLIGDPQQYSEITIPLSKLQKWTADELPDPYRLYLV